MVSNEEHKDGSRTIKIRFPNLAERAKEFAKKFSSEKADDVSGDRQRAAEALKGHWQMIDVDKVELFEMGWGGGAEGKTLAKAEREVDPKHGIVYTFRLNSDAASRYGRFNAGDRTGKEFDIRMRPVAYFDGHLENSPRDAGATSTP